MAASAQETEFFATPKDLQKWFRQHSVSAEELWIGLYKKATGKPSVTWAESVEEALCVGWIDGIRKSVDEQSYKIRFTPRRRGSIWSAINIKRATDLTNKGLMKPTGRKAFAARQENRSGIYSYEQCRPRLEEPYETQLRQNQTAWDFFQAQSPSYRKIMGWWVVSAKQEITRQKRLRKLIEESVRGKRVR